MHFYKDFTYREWILPFESKVSSALLLQCTKIHQFSIWNQALVLKAKPRCVNRLVLIMTERLTYFFLLLLRIAIIMISLIGSANLFWDAKELATHRSAIHKPNWKRSWSYHFDVQTGVALFCAAKRNQEKSRRFREGKSGMFNDNHRTDFCWPMFT